MKGEEMSAWGCPHEVNGKCTHINNLPCDPGMKGCVLAGRYIFANSEEKNARLREKQVRKASAESETSKPGDGQ